VIIEFIGLPASGKTTIAKEFNNKISESSKVIYPLYSLYKKNWIHRNLYKTIFVILFCIPQFNLMKKVISLVIKSRQIQVADNFRLIFNFLFFLSIREKYKNNNNIVIFDEGLVHHIWAVSVNSKFPNPYVLFSEIINKIDLTVKVDCPLDLIKARMERRIDTNNRHFNFINNIERIDDTMQNVIEYYLAENYITKYISIDNSNQEDINFNVLKIVSQVLIEKNERV
jgi:adenylate kinase family enzyme